MASPAHVEAGRSIDDRVRAIVFHVLATDPEHQADDACLIQDLGADSLDVVHFEFELGEAFGLGLDALDLSRAITVADILGAVRRVVDARSDQAKGR